MGFFDFLMGDEQEETRKPARTADVEFAEEDAAAMKLREEELDIRKDRVRTGEVVLHKDVVEEEQNVAVPVEHDEVVIERRAVNGTPSDEPITGEETVSIPVTAERVDVDKHTVVREEISAHKREVENTEHVRDVLHKEVAHIETEGDAVVSDADTLR